MTEHSCTCEKKYLPDLYTPFTGCRKTAEDLVFTGGRRTESLNGLWHYAADWYNTCIRSHWYEEKKEDESGNTYPLDYSFDEWDTIWLPCCWNTEKSRYFYYESSMVFTRTFRFRKNPDSDERILLRIGAASYLCTVFINRRPAGFHEGGSTPFCMDITDLLLDGENRILLVVDAARSPEYVPADNTDWFPYGGVYRDIELVHVPSVFIRNFRCFLVPDSGIELIQADVSLSSPADGIAVLEIPDLRIRREFPVREGSGSVQIHACPELWSPENPRLYDTKLSFIPSAAGTGSGGKRKYNSLSEKIKNTDFITDRTGFREFSVKGQSLYLNGKKIFLKGISCHEDCDERGRALTTEDRLEILDAAKKLGCNYLRLAHYPHHEEMARLADEKGMLLWEEIPVYWTIDFANGDTYRNAENQLTEMITRDFNRASVIIWSVGNENLDTDERFSFMSRLAKKAKELDPTRQVSAACLVSEDFTIKDRLAECIDIIGINEYCGWYIPDFGYLDRLFSGSHPDKPVIISEFGADARYGHHGTAAEKNTEECQAEVYRRQIDAISHTDYICGMSPWILFDFRCPRRTSYMQDYYNLKGLITSDRKHRKMAYYVLRDFYSKSVSGNAP